MKTITTISEPRIEQRPAQPYMGIRVQTPFKGMYKVVGQLEKELTAWLKQRGFPASGTGLLRYHVIDMAGEMDIEVGIMVAEPLAGEGRVTTSVLPAGTYASLIYSGSGLKGNKALLEWGQANGLRWDKWADPKGDAFGARYEAILTDPSVEPRKTKWQIELAIKLAENQK